MNWMKTRVNTQPSTLTEACSSVGVFPMESRVPQSIFQRSIESILAGIPNVLVFLDYILIRGKTTAEHKQNLYEVLNRLEKRGPETWGKEMPILHDVSRA